MCVCVRKVNEAQTQNYIQVHTWQLQVCGDLAFGDIISQESQAAKISETGRHAVQQVPYGFVHSFGSQQLLGL